MYWTKERLLSHLPQVYRARDAEIAARDGLTEGPLTSLLGALAEQIGAVEANVDQLYENWFVETCEPWVLPYLADLLGISRLPSTSSSVFTPRAFIANVINHRRRKGAPGMLQQLSRDSTGWHAHVVEYFLHLAQTQHLNRYRPDEWLTPDLRDLDALERLAGPFNTINRLPEVRTIDGPLPGKFNIPNVGLHVWPLSAFAPPDATGTPTVPVARFAIQARPDPFPVAAGDPVARWFLHPPGVPIPLFNRPLSAEPGSGARVSGASGERDVPEPLRRLPLHRELEALRQAIADGDARPPLRYFGNERPVLQLFADDDLEAIAPEEIQIVDFSAGTPQPTATARYEPANGGAAVDLPIRVAIDPARGQAVFAPGAEPRLLRAVYAYGFTMEMGGGPYGRQSEHRNIDPDSIDWQLGVSRLLDPVPNEIVPSLATAITAWNALPPGRRGVICVLDSMRYDEALTGANRIEIPAGSHLTLIAADWPRQETEPGIFERPRGFYSPDRLRPHLRGALEIVGTAPAESENPGALHLEGFLLEGPVTILAGHLGEITLAHSTVPVSVAPGLHIATADNGRNAELNVSVRKSQLGGLQCEADLNTITIEDSIVGLPAQPAAAAVEAPDADLALERSTFWGPLTCREVDASECIFMEAIVAERTQVGCVRYCYLAPGSSVPRPFRCQPSLAIQAEGAENDPALADTIAARVRPGFVSQDPAHPAYGRLSEGGPEEIRRGGENRREMGVFASLEEPLRADFLRGNQDEFLRAGLVAAIFPELPARPRSYGPLP